MKLEVTEFDYKLIMIAVKLKIDQCRDRANKHRTTGENKEYYLKRMRVYQNLYNKLGGCS